MTFPLPNGDENITDKADDERRESQESYLVLHYTMTKLNAAERLVITLLELEERSVREIAGLTGWSESNVKVRAFRARKSLKRILEKEYEQENVGR